MADKLIDFSATCTHRRAGAPGHGLKNWIKMAMKPRKYARKRSLDGLVTRSRPLTLQIDVVSSPEGYDQFDPDYEFVT